MGRGAMGRGATGWGGGFGRLLSSLRDWVGEGWNPSAEALGYFRASLRDLGEGVG